MHLFANLSPEKVLAISQGRMKMGQRDEASLPGASP
jgi:hypothetical protein